MNYSTNLVSQRALKLRQLDTKIEATQRHLDGEREVHRRMRELDLPLIQIERRIGEIAETLTHMLAARLALMEEMTSDPEGTSFR